MSKCILVLGDSLALPRLTPDFCPYDSTWPELLRKDGHRVIQVSIGGATSHDLNAQAGTYYKLETMPIDLVIIQSGIVDCAPRFAHKFELKIYQSIPLIGKGIISMLNRNWVRKLRNITYMKPKKYRQNIQKMIRQYHPKPVFLLGILPALSGYEKQLPGISKNTAIYNAILKSNPNFIDLQGMPENGIMSDFHHLNAVGHAFIYEQLTKVI